MKPAHTQQNPWPLRVLFDAWIYAALLLALAVTAWALVSFVGWAF